MGQHIGKHVVIPHIPLSRANDEGYPFKFRRKQFSVHLSFAMTINKAQRQTIPHVGIYLPQNVFSHRQLYVALSRGVSMKMAKILLYTDVGNVTKKTLYIKKHSFKYVFNIIIFKIYHCILFVHFSKNIY